MRANSSIRLQFGLALLTGVTVLMACVQPQVQRATHETAVRESAPDEATAAERVAELAQHLESMSRYAAQMEEIYAAQEAEILALRRQVASLAGQNRASE